MYKRYFKRCLDFILSLLALIIFSPVLIVLVILGTIYMRGNPFFTQDRPGKNEKIFKLIKFRTMDNRKDKDGKLLSDEIRLNKYGRILRRTSLDELPELLNILMGDMSIIGPRPLLPEYIPYYSKEEKHRHDVRPGLSGLAQINGRNNSTWEETFSWDLKYVNNISFLLDFKIVYMTIYKVIKKADVLMGNEKKVGRLDEERSYMKRGI